MTSRPVFRLSVTASVKSMYFTPSSKVVSLMGSVPRTAQMNSSSTRHADASLSGTSIGCGAAPPEPPFLLRLACLVCMVPRARATAGVLCQRKEAVSGHVTTTHRPHLFQPSFEGDTYRSIPRATFERFREPTGPPVLDVEMKMLVGYTKDEIIDDNKSNNSNYVVNT